MNNFRIALWGVRDQIPECFHSVYLFGSSLYDGNPEDVDILAVYHDGEDMVSVVAERHSLLDVLVCRFEGMIVDLVTLSDEELRMSGFLEKTNCEPIEGLGSP